MATKTLSKAQQEELTAQEEAIALLAQLGGRINTEEDILFQGTKFVLPATCANIGEGISFLQQRQVDEETETEFNKTYPYRPFDGARATAAAIREAFGFTMGKTLYSFFGKQPPQWVTVKTGPGDNDVEQVPWGAMKIPGLHGVTVHLGEARDAELGRVFHIKAVGPRKYRDVIEGLFKLIGRKLKEDSLYKGKAIDGAEQFIDVNVVDPDDVVFTDSVYRRLECDVWAFIRHEKVLAKLGHGGKFAVLFEGPYGTGKTLAALLTAQIAVEHGWTFLMCRPGQDDLTKTMEMARMYQPAVVFAEDVDTMAGPDSGSTIERHLDLLDGINQKGLKLLTVFTTNHADQIHKGMLRPGRIGAVIRVGAMDRDGVERLGRRVIGKSLDQETDWDEVWKHIDNYPPAFVREVFDRAVRIAIALSGGELGTIGTEAICLAADSLRDQHDLMEGASEERQPTSLATAMEELVVKAITDGERVAIVDRDHDEMFWLAAKDGV